MRTALNIICLTVTILWVAASFINCVSAPTPTQAPPAAGDVRQPTGNPDAFWNKLSWAELSLAEQELWEELGWDEDSWDGKSAPPLTEEMDWNELSSSERAAATKLGYDSFYWDKN